MSHCPFLSVLESFAGRYANLPAVDDHPYSNQLRMEGPAHASPVLRPGRTKVKYFITSPFQPSGYLEAQGPCVSPRWLPLVGLTGD